MSVATSSAGARPPADTSARPATRQPAPGAPPPVGHPSGGRLLPALVALLLVAVALAAGAAYAAARETAALPAVGPNHPDQVDVGAAFQAAALRRPDVLLLYGSSELSRGGASLPGRLFRDAPSGFSVLPIGRPGAGFLHYAQAFAALGGDLRGRKVAVSSTPSAFLNPVQPREYAGNFSRLHAYELAFSHDLSFDLKQAAARRMLGYADTLDGEPLLSFALARLAGGSPLDRLQYLAASPLGRLRCASLRLQDHAEALHLVAGGRFKAAAPRAPALQPPDWPALLEQAERLRAERLATNPFGFNADAWKDLQNRILHSEYASDDADFQARLDRANGWTDLDLALRTLEELGAEPLVLVTPLHGPFYDFMGVSPAARRAYYDRLHAAGERTHERLLAFPEHEADRLFFIDQASHPSEKGWLVLDMALDAFWHDRLP